MAEIKLKATTGRTLALARPSGLRVEGKVPGVVYGLDADPIPVTVDWKPLREALTTDAGLNALIDLDIDGDVALTIVKELQRHPIKGNVIHLDFLRVSADAEISVDVPIVLTGEAEKVERANGTVDHLLFSLTISAKPADIPNEIVVDITDLEIDSHVRVSDLVLPAGVSTDVDPEEAVVIGAAEVIIADEPTEGGEAAEGTEGGDAAGGGDDAADAGSDD